MRVTGRTGLYDVTALSVTDAHNVRSAMCLVPFSSTAGIEEEEQCTKEGWGEVAGIEWNHL